MSRNYELVVDKPRPTRRHMTYSWVFCTVGSIFILLIPVVSPISTWRKRSRGVCKANFLHEGVKNVLRIGRVLQIVLKISAAKNSTILSSELTLSSKTYHDGKENVLHPFLSSSFHLAFSSGISGGGAGSSSGILPSKGSAPPDAW